MRDRSPHGRRGGAVIMEVNCPPGSRSSAQGPRKACGVMPVEIPNPPVPPDQDLPPIDDPPDNPDVQPNAPVREPGPPEPPRW